MGVVSRNVILGIAALLLAGLAIGYYFGYPLWGLLIAMSGLLAMHVRRLLELERTLSLRKKIKVPDGDGIWARVLAGIRYQQQRVRRHKSRHRRLMKEVRQSTNALPDGVIALTENSEIQRFNAAAQNLVGLQRRRDRGQRIDNLIRHPDFVAYLNGNDFTQPVVIPAPKTDDCWLSLRLVPYSNNNRLLVLRDITERTRLSRMRREFVANASHELRTPLTVISGYLEAMASDMELLESWEKPLDEMTNQAHRMRNMLDELLALSRLEANVTATNEKMVDITSVIRESAALLDADGERVECRIHSDTQLLGEYAELTSVVSNLISNALRYGHADTPVIVSWEDAGADAVLSVSDQSDGVAPDDIPRLTERFFRVDRGRGRDSGGVGLGLAIVKHALARHNATLNIESTKQQGSTFSCRFPEGRLVRRLADEAVGS